MENKQTAIEWLVEQLDGENHLTENEIKRVVERAKEMEKQQIKEAHNRGSYILETSEQYYNETFKSE